MKNITTIFTLLLAFVCRSQESFPNAHPELLKGKQIKIVSQSFDRDGFRGFYIDSKLTQTLAPASQFSIASKQEALAGKLFDVTDVELLDGTKPLRAKITLKGEDGNVLYYKYDNSSGTGFPLEVVGGLTLPEDFYCDYITKEDYTDFVVYIADVGIGMHLRRNIGKGKPDAWTLHIIAYLNADMDSQQSATLVLENNKTIRFDNLYIIAKYHDGKSFKYELPLALKPKDIELLKANKILGVRIGEKVAAFTTGEKIKGVLTCMAKK